jgi:hypothetical protein
LHEKKAKNKLSAEAFIKTLIVKGGEPVPADMNGISSLIETKYL